MTEAEGNGGGSVAAPPAWTVYAGMVGTLGEFDPKSDSMTAYIERAMMYMDANNVPQDRRAATLLIAIGKSTFQVLRNLVIPAKLQDKSYDNIVKTLLDHYEPKPLVIAERFNFNGRQQGPTESVTVYAAELRRLSIHCEFGFFLDDALRDRFVCGLRSEASQRKLLVEAKLTFAQAVEIAHNMETAATKTKQLHEGDPVPLSEKAVNRTAPADNLDTCFYRRGCSNHKPAQCPFKNFRCHNCGKLGHIRDACLSPTQGGGAFISRRGWRARPGGWGCGRGLGVRTLQEEEVDEPDLEPMNHVRALNQICEKYSRPYIVDIQINGKPLAMEVDTGACISEQTLKQYFPNSVLKPSSTRFSAYSGHPLTTLRKMEVAVSYQGQPPPGGCWCRPESAWT